MDKIEAKEIHEGMVTETAEDSFSYATVKTWAAEFKRARDTIEDDPRSSRPKA